MHIVFGGAFNGKRQYVKELVGDREAVWYEGELPKEGGRLIVAAGVENWVKAQLQNGADEKTIVQLVGQAISYQAQEGQIWILTDINRGIVPADALEREMRDVVGRLYQHMFSAAESVTRIWYGIPQTIKGADWHEDLHTNGR